MKTTEERLETKRMKNLQKEISQLKKENAQLRKKNMRLENEIILHNSKEYMYDESEISEKLESVTQKNSKKSCSNSYCQSCGSSSVTEIPAGFYLVLVCQACGARSKQASRDATLEEQYEPNVARGACVG